ncbi:hypothetical protein M8009_11450 [Halomonas sp. ATCH28]|uniref:Uncharacterized protein n=1 Tax=Halomonas gemina TaxID=2945105 RepID=A0ABT0T1W1_9GAMM|nr:hypothetical protein [Halomonas gemina]MCL7940903.1 hypothetical protein [Halomonas gemina]
MFLISQRDEGFSTSFPGDIPGIKAHEILFFGIFVYLYLLSPYFVISGIMLHGGIISIALFFFVKTNLVMQAIKVRSFYNLIFIFSLFALYSLFVSVFSLRVLSITFQVYIFQVCIYIFLGVSVGFYIQRKGYGFDEALMLLLKFTSFIIFINSLVIIAEYYFPDFRKLVESFLYTSEESNINYLTREYRLRGIASAGAASLSLFHGLTLVILQALYINKKIGLISLCVSSIIIFISLLLIGRTGILISFLGIAMFHMLNLMLEPRKASSRRVFLYILLIASFFTLPLLFSLLFPGNVIMYSMNMFYDGAQGLEEEGTINALITMFNISDDWAELIFGIGSHSGGFSAELRADPGYMKMLTALGLPLSLLFYGFVIFVTIKVLVITKLKSLWIVFIMLMFISEFKEPFIIKGYSARLLWLVVGIALCYTYSTGIQKSKSAMIRYR